MFNEPARFQVHRDRVKLAMSPEQYGRHIGVSGGTVRRVERGYVPFLHNQKKFADALGQTHMELFGPPDAPELAQVLQGVGV